MHANRAYWSTGSAPYAGNAGFTITGTVISNSTLNGTATAASCWGD